MKRPGDSTSAADGASDGSAAIDARIAALDDWRGERLAQVRALIHVADPDVVEDVKWRGVPVWSHAGILCTGESYRDKVKLTFAKGAALADPAGLFNATLDGNVRRAIDLREGDTLDQAAFKALVRAAVAANVAKPSRAAAKSAKSKPSKTVANTAKSAEAGTAAKSAKPTPVAKASKTTGPVKAVDVAPRLLSGGNPQIAKGEGDRPVQAYIAAMPGWKSAVGRRIDALVTATVPGVRKAVKYNSPLWGMDGRTWFLSLHCYDRYVKVAFLKGKSLHPMPPVDSKTANTRYLHLHEGDAIDEVQWRDWLRQASALPGETL